MTTELDLLAGRLTLTPGAAEPIACERPMVGATLMRRLTEGRRAGLLPELIGSVFTLCASAQRSTTRRAVAAALGLHDDAARQRIERQHVALATAREHLQRFALDLPRLLPRLLPGAKLEVDAGWLRDAPVHGLPGSIPDAAAQQAVAEALPGWLERRLFGIAPQAWLQRWRAAPGPWLDEWSGGRTHPLARWLAAVRTEAEALRLPCRPLGVLHEGVPGLQSIAESLRAEPDFAERPLWQGAPAETGPWTRQALGLEPPAADTAWLRLGARLADVAMIAGGEPLAFEALAVGPGEGIACTEMSRGLLMHWVRLEEGARGADTARVAKFRVLAPTEWNFHPLGALGRALAAGRLDAEGARVAALSLDPCIRFDVLEVRHA